MYTQSYKYRHTYINTENYIEKYAFIGFFTWKYLQLIPIQILILILTIYINFYSIFIKKDQFSV